VEGKKEGVLLEPRDFIRGPFLPKTGAGTGRVTKKNEKVSMGKEKGVCSENILKMEKVDS